MSQFTTALDSKSTEYEHPAFELGATVFYKDWNGNWWTAEFVCDQSPQGWGFTTIKYSFDYCHIVKSVPFCCLYSLEDYIDQQPEYDQFEAAGN